MKKLLKKIFGELNITWPALIIFAIIMGLYTAIVAMLIPDGNSLHDIAVTPEWWVLPAIIIIVNSKKPLDAALKTFVFFLISQPLVYLFQVPFNAMGWGLFGYYKYWFIITLLTFPGGFIGWYIKKDKWYSALILSVMTVFLIFMGVSYITGLHEHFPNHLLSVIYCFCLVPILIFSIFKDKKVRAISLIIAIISLVTFVFVVNANKPYEVYNNTFVAENNIVFVGEPFISFYSGEGGNVELIRNDSDYVLRLIGRQGKTYNFEISDDEKTYKFEYHYDNSVKTIVLKKE